MTTYKTVRRIHIPSLCKIVFWIDLIFVLVFMIPFSLIWMVMPDLGPMMPIPMQEGFDMHSLFRGFAILSLVGHPIVMVVSVAFMAAIYNFIAMRTGGFKVEVVTETAEEKPLTITNHHGGRAPLNQESPYFICVAK
jgi:hypothetical protein